MTLDCQLKNAVHGEIGMVLVAVLMIGIPCLITGDILCLLTIIKLKAAVGVINVNPVNTCSAISSKHKRSNTCKSQSDLNIVTSLRARQNKAIITLMLILIFLNMSVLPLVVSYILWFVGGIRVSNIVQRTLLFCLYANSLANPPIIGSRVEDVNNAFKNTVFRAWSWMKQFFSG